MRLRNGKNTEKRNHPVLEKPVLIRNPKIYPPVQLQVRVQEPQVRVQEKKKTIEVSDFVSELMGMMHELSEWDVKTARIAGIGDIYGYILEYGQELKDVPRLEPFFLTVKNKIPAHLGELIGSAFIYGNDEETATNIKQARDNILAVDLMLK